MYYWLPDHSIPQLSSRGSSFASFLSFLRFSRAEENVQISNRDFVIASIDRKHNCNAFPINNRCEHLCLNVWTHARNQHEILRPANTDEATKRIIDNLISIGRSCQRTQDNEEDDPLIVEYEKCMWIGCGMKRERGKAAKDDEHVEGKERCLSKSSSSPRAFLFCSTSPRMHRSIYVAVGITTAGSKSFFRFLTRLNRIRTIVIDYIKLIETNEALKIAQAIRIRLASSKAILHSIACICGIHTYVPNDSFN